MNIKNDISQLAKATLKDNVKFLALGEQNINTLPPNKKNSSNNGENKIDKKFAKEYLEKKPLTTLIIANSDELRRKLDQTKANLKTTDDFEKDGRE